MIDSRLNDEAEKNILKTNSEFHDSLMENRKKNAED